MNSCQDDQEIRSKIDLLKNTNGRFDHVIDAQDWDCASQTTQNETLLSSTFTWKYTTNDELCEKPDFDFSTPYENCQQVFAPQIFTKYYEFILILFLFIYLCSKLKLKWFKKDYGIGIILMLIL